MDFMEMFRVGVITVIRMSRLGETTVLRTGRFEIKPPGGGVEVSFECSRMSARLLPVLMPRAPGL
jgi:hypothetical protein